MIKIMIKSKENYICESIAAHNKNQNELFKSYLLL